MRNLPQAAYWRPMVYSMNWVVYVTETASDYCAVQTKSQNVIQLIFVFKGRATARAVSPWRITAKARVRNQISSCEICGRPSGTEAGFSPSTSVLPCQYYSTISPHSSSFKRCSYKWINGRSLEILQKTMPSRKIGRAGLKNISTFFL